MADSSRTVTLIALFCAAMSLAATPADDEPDLTVMAKRLHMIPPGLKAKGYAQRVDFRARLDGGPEDMEEFYCLDEIWDWGDGTESIHEPDCDPYEEGSEVKRDFSDAHHFGRRHLARLLRPHAPGRGRVGRQVRDPPLLERCQPRFADVNPLLAAPVLLSEPARPERSGT